MEFTQIEYQERMPYTAKDGSAIVLRPAELEDAEHILRASQEIIASGRFIQKEEPLSLAEVKQFIHMVHRQGHMYTAVEVDGEVLGIARLLRGELKMKQHTAMFRTWLHEKAQGKGIGNKIMEYTIGWAAAHGLHKIWLTVFSANTAAYKLYQKYGFVVEGTQKEQALIDGSFQDEIFMGLILKRKTEEHYQ